MPAAACDKVSDTVNLFFADYTPDAHGTPIDDVVVRMATERDLPECGRLAAQREGGDAGTWAERLRCSLGDRGTLLVADRNGEVLGYGKATWLTPGADGGWNAPDGWYLSGVVVDPRFRRRGLGRALTQARCAWVWERNETIYYVANSRNAASIDLHRELGFFEVARDFHLPGVTFSEPGEGVLFACRPDSRAAQVVQLRVDAAR